jgi:hypothetical protein
MALQTYIQTDRHDGGNRRNFATLLCKRAKKNQTKCECVPLLYSQQCHFFNIKLVNILRIKTLMFCWPCTIVHKHSETNVMHFLIKGLYMFRALLAQLQEVLHKRHLVYCVRVRSVVCTRIGVKLLRMSK